LVEWHTLRLLDLNQANGRSNPELVALLEQNQSTKESPVLTEKLGDICASQGKPSSAVHAWTQALTLDPSPQQRIRLRLALGERLTALNREAEAYDNYEKLLQESPDYPDKPAIYRLLLPLAKKLGKTADAEKYQAALKE